MVLAAYLISFNTTDITNVSDVVHSLHALITQADCDIDVLDNQPASVILVSADGSTQLSGSQLATTVANFMSVRLITNCHPSNLTCIIVDVSCCCQCHRHGSCSTGQAR